MSQSSPVSADVQQKTNTNYPRADYKGALGTAGIGGIVWGGGEYFLNKRAFLDENENLADSFVRTVKEGLGGINDKELLKNNESLKTIKTQIDNCSSLEELKEVFKKNEKDIFKISDKYSAGILENIDNIKDVEKSKSLLKTFFEEEGKNKSYIQEIYKSCCDDAGKLVHDAQKVTKEKFDIVKNAAEKFTKNNALKAAVSFAVISAGIMCIFEYFKGRKAKKQAQQQV